MHSTTFTRRKIRASFFSLFFSFLSFWFFFILIDLTQCLLSDLTRWLRIRFIIYFTISISANIWRLFSLDVNSMPFSLETRRKTLYRERYRVLSLWSLICFTHDDASVFDIRQCQVRYRCFVATRTHKLLSLVATATVYLLTVSILKHIPNIFNNRADDRAGRWGRADQ